MRKIILHSYYGNGNLGDDAILYATEDILRRLNIYFQVIGHQVSILNTPIGKPISRIPFAKRTLYKNHVRWMLKQVDSADALILGGGGIIKDPKYGDITNNLRLIRYMQERRKPNMIYAVGVPRIWRLRSKIITKEVVEKTDYISCRDPESAIRIENLGGPLPHITGDPAIKVPEIMGIHPKPRKPDLQKMHVCFSIRKDYLNKSMIKSLAKLAFFLAAKYGAKISFIPMRTIWYGDDRIAHNLMKKELKTSNSNFIFFDRRPSVEEFVKELANTTLMIGMPLHSIVLSSSMGVPSIAIGYTEDVSSFMRYIQAEEHLFSLENICDSSSLIEKVEELFSSYNKVSRKILQNIDKVKEKMLLDENAIRQL